MMAANQQSIPSIFVFWSGRKFTGSSAILEMGREGWCKQENEACTARDSWAAGRIF
jgi:hypothetical protein